MGRVIRGTTRAARHALVDGTGSRVTHPARRPRAWVVTECYPRPGALHRCAFAHRQLAGLVAAGWDARVLVPNGWHPPVAWRIARAWRTARAVAVPRDWTLDGIAVADLQVQNRVPSRLSRPKSHEERVAVALDRTLARHGVTRSSDVLIAQFALPYGPAVAQVAARRGIPYVVYLRGDDVWIWPHDSERRMREFVTTLRTASLVLATSQALLDEARRLCGGVLPPATALPNGIDLTGFRPSVNEAERTAARTALGVRPSDVVVLCVAAPIARKGWMELLDALQAAAEAGCAATLLAALASAEPDIDVLREAAVRAPAVTVIPLRNVSDHQMPTVYRAADVFCLPSHGEGMSNAVLEAMASGLPVITSAVGGHGEIIRSGVDGMLVAPRDAMSLADALRTVIANIEVRARLGRAARLRAERIGDSRRAGALLADMLCDLLRKGTPDVEGVDAYGTARLSTPVF
jgi:glycosyltransferase involved in cell wall biosynthesis